MQNVPPGWIDLPRLITLESGCNELPNLSWGLVAHSCQLPMAKIPGYHSDGHPCLIFAEEFSSTSTGEFHVYSHHLPTQLGKKQLKGKGHEASFRYEAKVHELLSSKVNVFLILTTSSAATIFLEFICKYMSWKMKNMLSYKVIIIVGRVMLPMNLSDNLSFTKVK